MNLHACPGACGTQVPQHHLACRPCWHRLPAELRDRVNTSYRWRRRDPILHRNAIAEAAQWFRDNPRETTDA